MAHDFVSRPADDARRLGFRLDGERFTCLLRSDADAVLEWSEMAAAADDTDVASAAGAAFVSRFFRMMMDPDEYTRFRAHLKSRRTSPEVLVEIMQAVNEEMEAAVSAETSRPTGPPSRSSHGRTGTDERTLRIISLPDGEVEWADPPRSRQQQRNQRRKQPRRRAG